MSLFDRHSNRGMNLRAPSIRLFSGEWVGNLGPQPASFTRSPR